MQRGVDQGFTLRHWHAQQGKDPRVKPGSSCAASSSLANTSSGPSGFPRSAFPSWLEKDFFMADPDQAGLAGLRQIQRKFMPMLKPTETNMARTEASR